MQFSIDKPELNNIGWQPIAQGSSNRIFKGMKAGKHFILRLNADTDFAFGVDRLREASVLELIKDQTWAPVIVENNLHHDWCAMHYHGEVPQFNEQYKTSLIAIVKQIQIFSTKIDPLISASVYFDHDKLFNGYIKFFANSLNAQLTNDQPIKLCKFLIKQLQQLPDVPNVLMHQDLHPGNVCLEKKIKEGQESQWQLKLIDWEYSGWGSPWLDVAALHSYFDVKSKVLATLPSFSALSISDFNQGLNKAVLFNEGIACVWYYLRLLLAWQRDEIQSQEFEQSQKDLDGQVNDLLRQLSVES